MGSEDFDFYEGAEDEVSTSVDGVSNEVTNFTYTNLEYPCIIFKEGFTCPQHQLRVISNMVKTVSVNKDISLYFIQGSDLFKMGMLSGVQIQAFLSIVGDDKVIGYFDRDTKLEGDRLYTLCTIL